MRLAGMSEQQIRDVRRAGWSAAAVHDHFADRRRRRRAFRAPGDDGRRRRITLSPERSRDGVGERRSAGGSRGGGAALATQCRRAHLPFPVGYSRGA
jgi:hypothetical protein